MTDIADMSTIKYVLAQASTEDEYVTRHCINVVRMNFLRRGALPVLSLAVNVKRMFTRIDTNKYNVFHSSQEE